MACFEVLAALDGRDQGATRDEARSLAHMGHPDLAAELDAAINTQQTERRS